MKKSRFTEEQIIGFLKQADAGMPVKELCRKGGFSDAAFYKWRAKFGGMDVSDAKRLKELESENAKLKGHIGVRNYRALLGAVMQEDQLLAGSIADNIGFFDPQMDGKWLESCAKLAAIHAEIEAMPAISVRRFCSL